MKENLKIAILASIEAGKEIMKIYNSEFDYELKDDNSPLTIADKNANDIINQHLIKTTIPIISEENAQTDYTIRKEWDICWIVDPLDGTKEFIKRNGEFTVNIALIENNKPVLGVVYFAEDAFNICQGCGEVMMFTGRPGGIHRVEADPQHRQQIRAQNHVVEGPEAHGLIVSFSAVRYGTVTLGPCASVPA